MKSTLTMLISVFVISFLSTTVSVKAYDEDYYDGSYYFKNFNVDVEANDKRQFIITETIDVFFNKEKHGIKRDINLSSYFEKWTISDISVEGASFEVEKGFEEGLIIGNKEEAISGDKRYVIKYTLNYYDDEQVDGDYIYLDILPWSTKVENFKAEITYPRDGKVEDIKLVGDYGNNTNLAKYSYKDNKIIVESTNTIDKLDHFMIHAKLSEGTFKNAQEYPYPYSINKEIININITKDKNYLIERHFEINVTSGDFYPSTEYIILWEGDFADKVSDINISNSDIEIFDGRYMNIPKNPGTYNFVVSYRISPKVEHVQKFIIDQKFTYYRLKELEVNINSEVPILNNNVNFNELGMYSGKGRYFLKESSNTIFFKYLNRIHPDEEVSITLNLDTSAEERAVVYTSIVIGIISIILFIKFKRSREEYSSTEVISNSEKGKLRIRPSMLLKIIMLILSFIPIIKFHMEIPKFSMIKLSESLSFLQLDILIILMLYSALYFGYKSSLNNKFTLKNILKVFIVWGIFIGVMLLEINKLDVSISFSTLISVIISPAIAFSLAAFIPKSSKHGRNNSQKI